MVLAKAFLPLSGGEEEAAGEGFPAGATSEEIDGRLRVTVEFDSREEALEWLGRLAGTEAFERGEVWSDETGAPPIITLISGPIPLGYTDLDPDMGPRVPDGNAGESRQGGPPAETPEPSAPPPGPADTKPSTSPAAAGLVAGLAVVLPADLLACATTDGPLRATATKALEELVEDQQAIRRSLWWASSPEHALFESLDKKAQADLALRWLEASAGISEDARRAASSAALESALRVERYREFTGLVRGLRKDRDVWRRLAPVAVGLLVAALVVGFLFSWIVLGKIGEPGLNGWEAALLIFVFALVAVSPAVLLLLERPLAGIDAWSPGPLKEPPATKDKDTEADGAAEPK